ncbi:MAG: prolipoprotein diacylglyceryl transferase [Bdellovibrio sp.]
MVVQIDPVIFSFGPLEVRWYGLMYVIGFLIAGSLAKKLIEKGFFKVPVEKVDSLIITMLVCMFIGARTMYVFIYNWDYYRQNLNELFAIWRGGLSFHGALIGLLVGGFIFAKKNKISWAQTMDVTALVGSPGLFFGRIGNFMNGELYGRVTDMPWGLIFPAGGPLPRHPSQLYEGIMEGIFLSLILWWLFKRVKSYGFLAVTFVMGYGFFRFIVEFFREPDAQLGYYFGVLTMGQILCLLMIFGGTVSLFIVKKLNINY